MELPNFTLNIWGDTDDELVQQVNTDREEKTQGNEYAQFRKFLSPLRFAFFCSTRAEHNLLQRRTTIPLPSGSKVRTHP